VSYEYSFEDLLALLHGHAPAKVDAVALHRRRVEYGYLSVGLKIHCLGEGVSSPLCGRSWRSAKNSRCQLLQTLPRLAVSCGLPPVGSARSAILLLECIEHFIGSALSVTRKSRSRYALQGDLALVVRIVGDRVLLGSDTLRRYTLGDLATSFAKT